MAYEHFHKYAIGNIKKEFEATGVPNIFEMVEYAIMFCSCGESVIKVRIEDAPNLIQS